MIEQHDHYGEIRRREHYQGIAVLAERDARKKAFAAQVAIAKRSAQIVTAGHVDSSDDDILELLMSDLVTQE